MRWCAGSSACGGDGTAACTAACDYKKTITGVLVLACARARCLQCNLYPGSSLFVQVRSTTSSHSFFVRCSYEFASCSHSLFVRYSCEVTRELRDAPVCQALRRILPKITHARCEPRTAVSELGHPTYPLPSILFSKNQNACYEFFKVEPFKLRLSKYRPYPAHHISAHIQRQLPQPQFPDLE